ncbi:hypothetical protein [Enterovirga aerilata]|uniref:Uncharacterized protein n=1 Tax=Enterovirga aerilata TaxID=2730920 RepID=A0A849I2X2_9HYPH|nr:hypothetical protein [Enterovirga sp. DB1703]NNM71708.1 hypothetical protein [Enterovirga sp. DB1703]
MKHAFGAVALLAALAGASSAGAQPYGYDPGYGPRVIEQPGWRSRAPWQPPWQYDTGGDNDNRPELRPWQQSGGQQTGGPARNLLPKDNLHIAPR